MSEKVLQGTISFNAEFGNDGKLDVQATAKKVVERLAYDALFVDSDKKHKQGAAGTFATDVHDMDELFKKQDAATRAALAQELMDRISHDDDRERMLYVDLQTMVPALERKKGQGIADCALKSEIAKEDSEGDVVKPVFLKLTEQKSAELVHYVHQFHLRDRCACDAPYIAKDDAARLEIKAGAEITALPSFQSVSTKAPLYAEISRDSDGKRVIDADMLDSKIKSLNKQQKELTQNMIRQDSDITQGLSDLRQASEELRVLQYIKRHLVEIEAIGKEESDQKALARFADSYQKAWAEIEAATKAQGAGLRRAITIKSPLEQ